MGMTLLFIVTIAGLFPPLLQTNVQFTFQGSGTFWDGRNVCEELNGYLVTFVDKAENDEVLSIFSSTGEHFWIGVFDSLKHWTWSMGRVGFLNGVDYSNWYYSELLTVTEKICVIIDSNGYWTDTLCSETRPAVCYYEAGFANYILVTTPMTWERAQEYCQFNYTDLASVRNQTENSNIAALLTEPAWIGLYRGGWSMWSNNIARNFYNFRSEDSAKYQSIDNSTVSWCTTADSTSGLWSKVSCASSSNILCRIEGQSDLVSASHFGSEYDGGTQAPAPTRSKNTLRLRLQSDTEMNDQGIQDQIFQQLHDHLDDRGLTGFKLHWARMFHKEMTKKQKQDC